MARTAPDPLGSPLPPAAAVAENGAVDWSSGSGVAQLRAGALPEPD